MDEQKLRKTQSKKSHKSARTPTNSQYPKMKKLRDELEKARTILDLVRKRERLKRERITILKSIIRLQLKNIRLLEFEQHQPFAHEPFESLKQNKNLSQLKNGIEEQLVDKAALKRKKKEEKKKAKNAAASMSVPSPPFFSFEDICDLMNGTEDSDDEMSSESSENSENSENSESSESLETIKSDACHPDHAKDLDKTKIPFDSLNSSPINKKIKIEATCTENETTIPYSNHEIPNKTENTIFFSDPPPLNGSPLLTKETKICLRNGLSHPVSKPETKTCTISKSQKTIQNLLSQSVVNQYAQENPNYSASDKLHDSQVQFENWGVANLQDIPPPIPARIRVGRGGRVLLDRKRNERFIRNNIEVVTWETDIDYNPR